MSFNCHTNIRTEAELLMLLREGDRSGFSDIYQLYSSPLVNFAASRLSSLEEARDIIHDVFTALWDQRERLDIRISLKAYLFSAVRYRIIDHIRKNIVREEYAVMVHNLAETIVADTEEVVHYKKLLQDVDSAVDNLPPKTRLVYRLSRKSHLAAKEIAYELGISEQTVKNQLSSAVQKLRIACSKLVSVLIIISFL